ncbi:MAG TPA: hypothetical protein VFU50_01040 [Terriglobales bacterium]|nr:hypothetical protein [Terriglobales bacterium]
MKSRQNAEQEWTHDVLKVVRSLGKKNFHLNDVYARAAELQRLHPDNQHVEAKIRQQLQVLRDQGILRFIDDNGNYELLM